MDFTSPAYGFNPDSLMRETGKMFSKDIDSTYLLAELLVEEGKKVPNCKYTVKGYYFLAYIEKIYYGNPYKALVYYLEAIRYFETNPNESATLDAASIYENLGKFYNDVNQPEIALGLFTKAYNRYQSINNTKGKIDAIVEQADSFVLLKDTAQALIMLDSAFQMAQEQENVFLSVLTTNAGVTTQDLGLYDASLKYYQLTVDYSMAADTSNATAYKYYSYGLHNIGCIKTIKQEYELANRYLLQSLDLKLKKRDLYTDRSFFNNYYDLGLNYFYQNQYQEAVFYFEKAHDYTDGYDVSDEKSRFIMYEQLATAYRALNNFKKSDEYNQLYSTFLKKYIEKKELAQIENEKLNVDLITQRYFSQNSTVNNVLESRIYWFGALSAVIISFLISLIVYTQRKRKLVKRLIEQDIRKIKGI